MATSNPPEPATVKPSATVVLQDGKPKVHVPRYGKPCPYYRSAQGCFRGYSCNLSHSDPQTKSSPPNGNTYSSKSPIPGSTGAAPSPTMTGSSSSTPAEAPNDRPRKQWNPPRSNQYRRGRPQLSPEQIKEQAIAQSEAAKAQNAKKVTIVSEDDEQTWSLERDFLSTHSKTLGQVLSHSPKKAAPGVKDPIKNMRGFLRFGDNLDNLQLDDVKADDFDVFLSGLRANNNTEFTLEERQIILTLASDWGFEDLRNRTIREIEKLHPSVIDRVVLARRCKIAKWIRGALLSLTILPDPLTATEIQIMGTTTAALIWKAREEIFLHRLQVLTTKGRPASQIKCAGATCKQAVREAMLRVLEKPGAAGKPESDLVGLAESELKVPQSGQEALPCDACKAGTGLKDGIVELVEEFKLARIIMEVQLGKDGGKWLEPV